MGNLFRLGRKSNSDDALSNEDIFVDFENALPTEEEKEIYDMICEYKILWDAVLLQLSELSLNSTLLNLAINNPTDSNAQQDVWNTVVPVVEFARLAYDLLVKFDEFIPKMLFALCDGDHSVSNFECKQALSKLFAHFFSFVIDFGTMRMEKSELVNMFSYYRKVIGRKDDDSMVVANVDGVEVNNIIIFLASPNAYMTKVCELMSKVIQKNSTMKQESVTNSFISLARLCKNMLENQNKLSRFKDPETKYFIKKFLVAILIMYDNVHPVGLFNKSSQIDLRNYIKLFKIPATGEKDLLSILRFSSKHFNDADSSSSVKQLFL